MPRRPDTPPKTDGEEVLASPLGAELNLPPPRQPASAAPLPTQVTEPRNTEAAPNVAHAVHIAVQGCCHGELDKIYDACREHEATTNSKIDFLLCCGDFQCVRNPSDLDSMAVPEKYKAMGDFHKYFTGERVAPYLTIFIGGNHEASNVLFREYYGGFVAPNIYYLGHAGVVEVCGVVVAGVSGIFKGRDFQQPYPVPPYNSQSVREAYHVRQHEIEKLRRFGVERYAADSSLKRAVDVVMSHDWPIGVTKYGDEFRLLKQKPFLEDDLKHGVLGNPHLMPLLEQLRPKYWLSAHLHCHFTAKIPHTKLLANGRGVTALCSPTQFLALDKCVHQRRFLDFINIDVSSRAADRGPIHQSQWLRVVQQTHPPPIRGLPQQPPKMSTSTALLPEGVRCTSTRDLLELLSLNPMPSGGRPSEQLMRPQTMLLPNSPIIPTVRVGTTLTGSVPLPVAAQGDSDGCEWVEDTG